MKPKLNRSVLLVSIAVYTLLTFLLCIAEPSYANFAKHKKITIQASQVNGASALAGFPVMIQISGADFNDIEDDVDADGYDLIFRAADGTPLAHEIEVYDEAGNILTAWVKIPSLSATSDTDIYVYYGDPGITSPTETPSAVWDSSYRGVWHMNENPTAPAPQIQDSTTYGNHGTSYGGMSSNDQVSGKVGGALDFDDNDDYIYVGDKSSLNVTAGITLETWLKPDTIEFSSRYAIYKNHAYFLDAMRSFDKPPHFYLEIDNVGWQATGPAGALTTSWNHVIGTYDSTGEVMRVYINGVEQSSADLSALTSDLINVSSNGLRFSLYYRGLMDEVRLSSIARSADWIKTQFNNQNSPGSFYIIGSEESADSTAPVVTITAPTTDPSYFTSTDAIALAGTASDNGTVVEVRWSNDRGGSGVCSGTTDWSASIDLYAGDNVIAITAEDIEGNTASDSLSVTYTPASPDPEPDYGQCSTDVYTDYSAGFDAADLDLLTVGTVDGRLVLQTGSQAIDHNNIVIPFEQEVWVNYLFARTAHEDDFGWFLRDDAVDGSGNFIGYTNIPADKKHAIFRNIHDGNVFVPVEGDGILDLFQDMLTQTTLMSESAVAAFDDGTGYPFIVDGINGVTPRDMKKSLGTFAAGSEIVFFLAGNQDYDSPTVDPDWILYTKTDWNSDTYDECTPGYSPFDKEYDLGVALVEGPCRTDRPGWLSVEAFGRLQSEFGITLSGIYTIPITFGEKVPHVIVGAPADDPKQWILGYEGVHLNLYWDPTDYDLNDLVFRIERRTGGSVQLKSDQALVPPDADAYYTAVNIAVYDKIPGGTCLDKSTLTYYLSIDNGANWVEVTAWDEIKEFSIDGSGNKILGNDVSNWSPGDPEMTYRSRRMDFAGLGFSGRELIWKAEMTSDDDQCVPEIIDLELDANLAVNSLFSRSSPVVVANVLYSGSYETPAPSWTDKANRGHLKATRIYDPSDPNVSAELELWDAGLVLNSMAPSARTIYFPDVSVTNVVDEVIATADGTSNTFSGTLAHSPVLATSLTLTDQHETFEDKHTTVLEGNLSGTGTINRFTGEYSITFNDMPADGTSITAGYSYYTTASVLKPFTATNITNDMLGLDDTQIVSQGYVYDLNGDDDYTEDDGDWLVNWVRGYKDGSSTPKEWLLGPIDHSTPAVVSPPGIPQWYFGTDITDAERDSYIAFKDGHVDRPSVIFVGSLDGMLHAFDAGKFRHGDNSDTGTVPDPIDEDGRGYFLWEDRTGDCPAYCSAVCSLCPDYGTGEELWAFIPANLLPRFKNNILQGDDRAYVDASPALADINIGGTWSTVLLSAEGIGGDTVFALDVTDPHDPSFLWEFADPDLFRSRSSPSVSKIGRIFSEGAAKWVAFFVSGRSEDAGAYPSIYILDIVDGSVVERIVLDAAAGGVGGVPSGQPTVVDSDGNGYLDRLYIGTDKGLLYRVNIPDNPDAVDYGISHCVINQDFTDDAFNTVDVSQQYHPIYGSPVVIIENQINAEGVIDYDLKIFFGTGDSPYYDENINMADTRYHFFAYRDESSKGQCDQDAISLDWFFELPQGHRIFASAFAAAGQIYFGTSTSETEDPCETPAGGGNLGKIYAFSKDGTPAFEQTVGNIIIAPLVQDEHLYIKTQSGGLQSFGDGKYNNEVRRGGFADFGIKYWREVF